MLNESGPFRIIRLIDLHPTSDASPPLDQRSIMDYIFPGFCNLSNMLQVDRKNQLTFLSATGSRKTVSVAVFPASTRPLRL